MEYGSLVWMGASATALRQLDKVQRRALKLIGPGTHLARLSHRRTVAALCYLYKLHYLPDLSSLKYLLPPPDMLQHARPTRQSTRARHSYQLQAQNPTRSSLRHLRSFPNAVINTWNSLPPALLRNPPDQRRAQTFKANVHRHLMHSNWLASTDSL